MTVVNRAGINYLERRLQYTAVAIALHWAIAALIIYNLSSGLLRQTLPHGFFLFHVSSGITILALTIVRLVWRLTHRPPPLLPMAPWERGLAHIVHVLLYMAMLVLPLSGWAMVSANPPPGLSGTALEVAHQPLLPAPTKAPDLKAPAGLTGEGKHGPPKRGPVMIWGLFKLPMIGPINEIGRTPQGVLKQRELHERIESFHLIGGWIMIVLLILHIGGALKHQFIDRERELVRMGLGRVGNRDRPRR